MKWAVFHPDKIHTLLSISIEEHSGNTFKGDIVSGSSPGGRSNIVIFIPPRWRHSRGTLSRGLHMVVGQTSAYEIRHLYTSWVERIKCIMSFSRNLFQDFLVLGEHKNEPAIVDPIWRDWKLLLNPLPLSDSKLCCGARQKFVLMRLLMPDS